jgi:hypothetical protein
MKTRIPKGVTIEVSAVQDDLEVRGNASVTDDAAADKACEDDIIRRLNDGDIWAWAVVTVTVCCGDFSGRDNLGACSYASEDDFRAGRYFEDMVAAALDDLRTNVWRAIGKGKAARAALKTLK